MLKRDFSDRKTEEAFDTCREIGLRSLAFNIMANPTETREEMLDTMRLNARLMPSAARISLGYPYPGTEYYDIAEKLDTIDPNRAYHNYSQQSRLKWTEEDRLWIDKLRTFYWWWMNAYLGNECSPVYESLTSMVLQMPYDVWKDEDSVRKLFELDATTSALFTRQNVPHYNAPFHDRPDITLLQCPRPVQREMLDEH